LIKIAHILTAYRGSANFLEAKLKALQSYGDFDIALIVPPPENGLEMPPSTIRELIVPMVRPIRPLADLRTVWKLYQLIRREKFDIVHTHSSKPGVVGTIAAWMAGVPVILHTYHGLPFFEGQNRIRYHEYRMFEIIACKFRHHAFSQNYQDIPECIKMMGSAEKVSYEGNGVNVDEVRTKARQNTERAESDFPPGDVRIALVSRLEPVKRIGDFLKACALLVKDGVQISAIIAGHGLLEPSLRKELNNLGLTERVRMLGWAPHALSLMALSNIVVLTSEKEGIPRSLMEAMALGKPVVATDVPGTQELVVNNETGLLTPLGDPQALADKIKLLSSNPELCQRFGKTAKARVEKHFNDLKIAAFLRDFYLKNCHQWICRPRRPSRINRQP